MSNKLFAFAAAALVLAACGPDAPDTEIEPASETDVDLAPAVPIELTVGNYNIQWFGDDEEGPSDEALQLERAAEVLAESDVDLWLLSEIVDDAAFEGLLDRLPGFDGFMANDPRVEDGADYYRDSEQKLAIIYRTALVEVSSPRLILTAENYAFGSRPPLAVDVSVIDAGSAGKLTLIGLHMKAMSDQASYQRRVDAADALHGYLHGELDGASVLVVGDWNDDIDTSIASGKPTPYGALLNDGAYRFLTKELSFANIGSRVVGHSFIDHQLAGGEVAQRYVQGSTVRVAADTMVPEYASTTSDHYPIVSSFSFDSLQTAPRFIVNEVLANEPGSETARELVEIVATGCGDADLAGYALRFDGDLVFQFPPGSLLAAGEAAVVFGRASGIPVGLPHTFGAAGLGLLNGGGEVLLIDPDGSVVSGAAWTSSKDGVSITRAVDGDGDSAFIEHPKSGGRTSSPGTRRNGSAFLTACATP